MTKRKKKTRKNLDFENNYDFYEKILFELCGKFPDLRPYKKKEEITEKERENLNYINLTRPLPEGWTLEGPVVVDDKDQIHYEHPYLEQFIDEFIELNNKAVDQYNNNVKKKLKEKEMELELSKKDSKNGIYSIKPVNKEKEKNYKKERNI